MTDTELRTAEGPYFEEFRIGAVFASAPAVTLTDGLQAVHQSILGERLRLVTDHAFALQLAGGPIASPSLVWNISIGQSTTATQHVKANLFYRGLAFRRFPHLGDTLSTRTEVVALRENARRAARHPTGLVVLRIETTDQDGRTVLDYRRCAMIPLRNADADTGHSDDINFQSSVPAAPAPDALAQSWHVEKLDRSADDLSVGDRIAVDGGDVVSAAPELARLTMNIAAVHHDSSRAGGRRLVYGGHTIALALSQTMRAIPTLGPVLSWETCDHLAPVYENDTITSTVEVERLTVSPKGLRLVDLRCRAAADRDGERVSVLDWRFTVLRDGLPS